MAKKTDELCIAFANEYHVDRNGTRAARAVGILGDDNVVAIKASRLLRDARVRRELERLRKARAKRTGISGDQVVRELARLGFSDITEVVEWDEQGANRRLIPSRQLPARIRRAIKEIKFTEHLDTGKITVSIKLHDKVKPLELLGRHTGALTEKPDASSDEEREQVVVHLPDNGRGNEEN
jgi:phage terminase small subunit